MATSPARSLAARGAALASAAEQRRALDSLPLAREFPAALREGGLWPLRPRS